jgi:hypothetical protein
MEPEADRLARDYLANDAEVQANLARMRDSYTFTTGDLVLFAFRLLYGGYLYCLLDSTDGPYAPDLDDDIEGASGMAWAIREVANLQTTEEGMVVMLDEEEEGSHDSLR